MPSATTTSTNYEEDFLSDRILNFNHNNDFLLNGSNFPVVNNANGNNNHGFPSGSQRGYPTEKDFDAMSDCVTRNSPIHVSYNGASHFFTNKISNGMINSAFTTPNPGNKIMEEFHSLQNSPFYDKLHLYTNSNNFCMQSNGNDPLYMQRRPPQRELFPITTSNGWATNLSVPGGVLYPTDRLHYINCARSKGFIVGPELEHIKENSRRSTSHCYGRISAHFRNRYGETEAKTKASYLQLGVRVPTKDHVSEIVGKGGQKIKLIREETGALITTPGENEDHVFIIEAPPEIALRVAELISNRAQEITQSKANASERRRGSTNSIPGCTSLFNANSIASATTPNGGQRLISRSPDDLQSVTIPSPSPLLKSPLANGGNYSTESGFFSSNGNGLSSVGSNNNGTTRTLLARSKISVPQDMVGKIIGTQGSIITTIQKDTGTEIKSPPKEVARGPSATSDFEISAYQSQGMTVQDAEARVQQAKQLIGHLVMRQLERRYSGELDDNNAGNGSTGKSRNNSNGEDFDGSCNGKTPTNNIMNVSASWMWPDVQQMDAKEAQDVLDRILAESKSKTRRVKELQAATAASTTGSLPTTPCGLISGGNSNNNSFAIEFFPTTDKPSGSCQNSPFHQSRIPSHNSVFSANAATAPVSMNLFDRRLTNVDFHSESEFPDNSTGLCCPNLVWPNIGPRHSFSAGAPNSGDSTSPTVLRRHTMASAEPYKSTLHNGNGSTNETSVLDKNSEVERNLIQALENLGLGGDELRSSCQDHPPGFASHFSHVGHQSSSSTWPVPSFFSNNESQEDLTARTSKIWGNAAAAINGHLAAVANAGTTTQPVIPAVAASISSSSSGSVNRCGIIGEERRRPSPSNSTSTAPESS